MANLVLDMRKVKAYEHLNTLGEFALRSREFIDGLWRELLLDTDLMQDFMYYLDHHSFCDRTKCRGYSLTDLYFYKIRKYDVKRDAGKNNPDCNKEGLVLDAFMMMAEMKRAPEKYINRLSDAMGQGMDLF